MKRIRGGVPHHLIDADDLVLLTMILKLDEKDCITVHGIDVDRAAERDRKTRVKVEAVECVDDPEDVAVRGTYRAVGQGKADLESRNVGWIWNGKSVARKGGLLNNIRIKESLNASHRSRGPE